MIQAILFAHLLTPCIYRRGSVHCCTRWNRSTNNTPITGREIQPGQIQHRRWVPQVQRLFCCPCQRNIRVLFFIGTISRRTKSSFVITVNDRGMLEGVSGAIHDEYNMSSNMVVVSLRKGDHVNVMTHPTWSVDPRQRLRYSGNSFSGFLLYPR